MMQIGLIGLSAGAAAALLFASVTSGTLFSIPLFYLAPLPIMIAGLGWSHWSALVGTVAASAVLGLFFGGTFMFAFLSAAGLPAWWLSYLTMLARPAGESGNGAAPAALEWYPPGRLVVWASVLGALVVLVAILMLGTDADSFRANLHSSVASMLGVTTAADGTPPTTNAVALVDFLVVAIPPAAAVLATVTNVINLWLAARVVKFSGRLARPWPQLSEMTFPPLFIGSLAVAIAVSFLGGMPGILASVVAASLFMAFGVLGFAVLHSVTQGISSRGFLLAGVYASVVIFGWPVMVLCLLGLIETTMNLRARAARKRGPPARL